MPSESPDRTQPEPRPLRIKLAGRPYWQPWVRADVQLPLEAGYQRGLIVALFDGAVCGKVIYEPGRHQPN